jgi:hypothetical protein
VLINLQDISGAQGRSKAVAFAVDAIDDRFEPEINTPFSHLLGEGGPDIVVESAEKDRSAVVQDDLGTEAVENSGELDRNVAASGDEDFLRLFLEVEDLVGCDAVLEARNRGLERTAASGDQDVLGGIGVASDLYGVAIEQPGPTFDDPYSGAL